MQKQRLLQLARFLREQIPNKLFDLSVIGRMYNNSDIQQKPKPSPTCGYAGCCIGWTPSAFPRSRWKISMEGEYDGYINTEYTDSKGNRYTNFDAARKFYGLNASETSYLFEPTYYPYKKRDRISVAERIEKFVNTNGKSAMNAKNF